MNRRTFLELTGGVAATAVLGTGLSLARATPAGAQTPGRFGNPAQRTLVVVEMEGGNDAINTLVPATGTYHDLRPTVALGDDELLHFDGLAYGVHPALAGLESFWNTGQLAGFYGIGLPQQSRSHFVAQDAWRSATPGEPATSGWLGRWLEATTPVHEVPLRAISLGSDTLAAQGATGRAVAVQSIENFRLSPPHGNQAVIDALAAMGADPGTGVFGQAQAALPATIEAVDELQAIIATVAPTQDDLAPDDTAALFAAAQAIIQADVGTQVLYLTIDGFDTHAGQRQRHHDLLASIGDGVDTLFSGLAATGHAERTLVLTISEFGRRAAENGSAGTDHGNGGLAMLLGPAVARSAIYGGADLNDLDDGDLAQVLDARSVYDNALRWLGGVHGSFEGDWSKLDALAI